VVCSECLDLAGNAVVQARFDGLTESLVAVSSSTVDTLIRNPFEFLLEPWAMSLPIAPDDDASLASAPYRQRRQACDAVTDFAYALANEVGGDTVAFVTTLNRRISQMCQPTLRLDGEPQPPALTLEQRSGACRDLSVLFIDAARAVGLPARFVSGYQESRPSGSERYLHAWAEVYLPGAAGAASIRCRDWQ
jgi:transglutaminase-like putative cysteine protease